MFSPDEFNERLKLISGPGKLYDKWDVVLSELIKLTYPWDLDSLMEYENFNFHGDLRKKVGDRTFI